MACGGGQVEIVDVRMDAVSTAAPTPTTAPTPTPTATPTPMPTPTPTPMPTPTPYPIYESEKTTAFQTVDIYEVPVGEYYTWRVEVKGSINACNWESTRKGCGIEFKVYDVLYFLFNPPNASEHPSDTAWKTKYANFTNTPPGTTLQELQENVKSKIIEVSNTLTLWENGATQLTDEQGGYLRVFHPGFPDSNWNHPTKCQQVAIRNQSEPFCRWTNLVQVGMWDIEVLYGNSGPALLSSALGTIQFRQGEGNSYAETLALILEKMHRDAPTASPTATTASPAPRPTPTPTPRPTSTPTPRATSTPTPRPTPTPTPTPTLCTRVEYCVLEGTKLPLADSVKAIEYFDEAIRLDPNFAPAYDNRGFRYHALGEYEKALENFTEAIRVDPNYAIAYASRGSTYHVMGEYEKAAQAYNEAIRLDPGNKVYISRRDHAISKMN